MECAMDPNSEFTVPELGAIGSLHLTTLEGLKGLPDRKNLIDAQKDLQKLHPQLVGALHHFLHTRNPALWRTAREKYQEGLDQFSTALGNVRTQWSEVRSERRQPENVEVRLNRLVTDFAQLTQDLARLDATLATVPRREVPKRVKLTNPY